MRLQNFVPRLNLSPEILPQAVGGGIFNRFSNFDKCRPEVGDDAISGEAVDMVSIGAHAKFGDSGLNSARIIRLCPAAPVLHTSVQYLQPTGSS